MSSPIANRYDFALVFDVTNGNPNGDPDTNSPRMDPDTNYGLVSDVCLKRKIRNFICLAKNVASGNPDIGYDIYVKERAILNDQQLRAYSALGLKIDENTEENAEESTEESTEEKKNKKKKKKKKIDPENIAKARAWMCQTFFDVRMFGAMMATEVNCGQLRGPVQIVFARSVEPITPMHQTLTRVAVTTRKDSLKQDGANRGMGSKEIVPYAVYVVHGFISPFLAAQTGFSDADLELLWNALKMMFEHDRSASRGEMSSRKLFVFKHKEPLGNAPAHSLFERIRIERVNTENAPRVFGDYKVSFNREGLQEGITVQEML